jgi:hypothetical protein
MMGIMHKIVPMKGEKREEGKGKERNGRYHEQRGRTKNRNKSITGGIKWWVKGEYRKRVGRYGGKVVQLLPLCLHSAAKERKKKIILKKM